MEYLLLLLGFTFLIFSGRVLISGSVAIARRLNLSPFVIGLTVVAVGTSAPELLVSITGALKDHADVALYNVVGSNISNILLVLAIATIILPIPVRSRTIWFDGTSMLVFSALAWFFLRDLRLVSMEGMALLIVLFVFIVLSVKRSRKDTEDDIDEGKPGLKNWQSILAVVVASGGLALGADLLVDNAVSIAKTMGLSERVISVSMIAVGTSVPELTTSAIAAFRKQTDISIGNIIGSNIFNVGLVLGLTSMVKPMEANPLLLKFDIFWFLGVGVLLIFLLIIPRRSMLSRWKGLLLLSGYLIYLYLVLN